MPSGVDIHGAIIVTTDLPAVVVAAVFLFGSALDSVEAAVDEKQFHYGHKLSSSITADD